VPEAARRHLVEYDLFALPAPGAMRRAAFSRSVTPAHMELFHGGKRMTLARWPNREFTTIAAAADPDPPDDGHGRPLGRLGDISTMKETGLPLVQHLRHLGSRLLGLGLGRNL
jgi:hypothetical protein